MLAFGFGSSGEFLCSVHQGGKEHFGNLAFVPSADSSQQAYELMKDNGGVVFRITGQASQKRLQVFSGDSQLVAYLEPGSSSSHNQVTCMPNADVALVVLALLG